MPAHGERSVPGLAGRPWDALLWTALFAFAAALCLHDVRALDYWWLLRTGELIVATGEVPRADLYTYSVPGARWIDIHWLYQLGLWGTFQLGGHAAVVLATAAIVLATLALVARIGRRPDREWLSVAALLLLLVVACPRFAPRSEITSFFTLAAMIALLDRFERRGDGWLYALVPLQLFWVNTHGLFAIGPVLCAMHLAAELARPLATAGEGLRVPRVGHLGTVTALCLLVCLANPNGIEGALYPLQQLQMIGSAEARGYFGRTIAELAPLFGGSNPLLLTAFSLLAALSLAALLANWRQLRLADLLAWIAFFYLAMGAKRNAALFAIVAAPMLVRNAHAVLDRRDWSPLPARGAAIALSALLVLLTADAARGGFLRHYGIYAQPGLGVSATTYPAGAVAWIERNHPPGPIAHAIATGGYLIYHLHPDYPVLLDGRLEVFGPERFAELSFDDPGDFARLDARFGFGTVLLRYDDLAARALIPWLLTQPTWRVVHVDDVSVLAVRAPSPFPAVDPADPDLFPPVDGSRGWIDERALMVRGLFYAAAGRNDLALATAERVLELFPDSPARAMIERLRQDPRMQ